MSTRNFLKKSWIMIAMAIGLATLPARGQDWTLSGNTLVGTEVLGGTHDASRDVTLKLIADGDTVFRFMPTDYTPNLIGGHAVNWVTSGVYGATICGGGYYYSPVSYANFVTDIFGTVGGGASNRAGNNAGTTSDKPYATVSGGNNNTASGSYSSIGGGSTNQASGSYSAIGGGTTNQAPGSYSTIGGGGLNYAGTAAVVGGGYENEAGGSYSTVGGGFSNIIESYGGYSTVCGGKNNLIYGGSEIATICGGELNEANGGTVGGGYSNYSGGTSTVGGGSDNLANNVGTVGGGYNNTATGGYSTVPGGWGNTASAMNSFAAGQTTTASSNNSFAMGTFANADWPFCFIWNGESDFRSCASSSTFNVNVAAGVWFGSGNASIPFGRFINTSTGGYLGTGGNWVDNSTMSSKTDVVPVIPSEILETLRELPLNEWSYIEDPLAARHLGPMAEDFYSTFGLGVDDGAIASMDTAGVALAAIKALDAEMRDRAVVVAELEERVARLQANEEELKFRLAQIAELKDRLARLESGKTDSQVTHASVPGQSSAGFFFFGLLLGILALGLKRR